jgi:acyl carrier protein
MVDMVIVLENAFGFKIREEQAIREIRTLGDIHRFVIEKKAALDAAP